ncbi:MAG: efflux RND transporter permease subunit [Chloroflexia bacterium]|nr:efflux RND transporter permease subunit [Chloroflexia bacterium]
MLKTIKQQLLSVTGVSQVVVMGGEPKQFQVLADPYKMKYYNVSLSELLIATEETNSNASGGMINQRGQEYIVRATGRSSNVKNIGNSVVKINNDKPVKISDIADVKMDSPTKIGDAYLNEKPAVILTVLKQPNTNTLELTSDIDKTLNDLKISLPKGVNINSKLFNQADFIETSIKNVQRVLVEGGIFVAIVLFLFLLNFRTTVISLTAIPVSLLLSIITLKIMGLTINTMSLGGMAIAIGVLVDDAIIDVENVLKRLKENHLKPE